jgi:hypothetical protein
MRGSTTGAGLLPETEVLYGCTVRGCDEVATVTVGAEPAVERPLCPMHWQRARATTPRRLRTLRVLPRPGCSVGTCADPACVTVTRGNGHRCLLCERHYEGEGFEVLIGTSGSSQR